MSDVCACVTWLLNSTVMNMLAISLRVAGAGVRGQFISLVMVVPHFCRTHFFKYVNVPQQDRLVSLTPVLSICIQISLQCLSLRQQLDTPGVTLTPRGSGKPNSQSMWVGQPLAVTPLHSQ